MALAAGGVPVLAAEVSPAVSVIQEGAQQESDIRVAEAAQQSETSQKNTQVQSKTVPSSVQTDLEGTKEAAALDSRRIMINLASRSLALYEGTKKIRLYPIGPGKPETPTPLAIFPSFPRMSILLGRILKIRKMRFPQERTTRLATVGWQSRGITASMVRIDRSPSVTMYQMAASA